MPGAAATIVRAAGTRSILTGVLSSEAVLNPGGGFMNAYWVPDPNWVSQGAMLAANIHCLGGDVYGFYISTDSGKHWLGQNQGSTDVKEMKTITIFGSTVTANLVYRLTSNYDGGNASAVVTRLENATIDTTTGLLAGPWTVQTTIPSGTVAVLANNTYRAQGDGGGHPRQTGRMGVSDPTSAGRVFLAMEGGVIMIDAAGTISTVALTGAASPNVCTGLEMDYAQYLLNNRVDLFVTVRSGTNTGVWRIVNAPATSGQSARSATKYTGVNAPTVPENVKTVTEAGTTTLYVANGQAASHQLLLRLSGVGTAGTWTDVTPPGALGTPDCLLKGMDAQRNTTDTATWVVCAHDGPDLANRSKVFWSRNAGAAGSWTSNVQADTSYVLPDGRVHWLFGGDPTLGNWRYYALEFVGAGGDYPDVRIDPNNISLWTVAGRSGCWQRNDAATAPLWKPTTLGNGATVAFAVATHPTDPDVALSADSDWVLLEYPSLMSPNHRSRNSVAFAGAAPLSVDGKGVAFTTEGYGLHGAADQGSFDKGTVMWTGTGGSAPLAFSKAGGSANQWYNVLDSGGLTLDQRMNAIGPAMPATFDFGVRGLLSLHDSTDGRLVILAFCGPQITSGAVTGPALHAGIWRLKVGAAGTLGQWTRVSAAGSVCGNTFPVFRGAAKGDIVLFYDPTPASGGGGGFYRSLDAGATFTNIWPIVSAGNSKYAGRVAASTTVANRFVVTVPISGGGSKIWRINNAHNGSLNANGTTLTGTITALDISGSLDSPGSAGFFASGKLGTFQGVGNASSNPLPGFFTASEAALTSASTASPLVWVQDDGPRIQGSALFVTDMAITADDKTVIYSNDGLGIQSHTFGTSQAPALTKPRVAGLTVFNSGAAVNNINHRSFKLLWSDIEPNDTRIPGNAYDWSTMNAALALTTAGQYAKVGVEAGRFSPPWVKTMTGTVTVTNVKDAITDTVPLYWLPEVQDAYARMQTEMARLYDSNPQLLQVVCAEPMTIYMEPFIMSGGDDASNLALYNAGLENPATGYTQAGAITTALTNMFAAWKQTRVELATHVTWEIAQPAHGPNLPWTTERDFLNPLTAQYGEQLCITDYGLGPSDPMPTATGETLANATTQYGWMKVRAMSGQGPTGYQATFGTTIPSDDPGWMLAVDNCVTLHGCYYESATFAALTGPHQSARDAELKSKCGT